jgi:uncharacterized protein YecT (DUF1311 family)
MNKMFFFILIILTVCLPRLEAVDAIKHPIDAWLAGCLEKNPSTHDTNACLGQAYEKWDLELNRVYGELSSRLGAETGIALREAQRAWLVFRDRELAYLSNFYGSLAGTMYGTMLAADRVDLVKRRALELASYLDVIKQQ